MKAPLKVLVIEDDPEYQDLLVAYLKGHDVRAFSCAEDAEPALARSSFDLVVTDLNLMGLSGFQVLEKMREMGLIGKCPVIISTSQSDEETCKRAIELGVSAFIGKPYSQEQLLELVGFVLKK